MQVSGSDLPRLAWQHVKPFDPARIDPVHAGEILPVKPSGGLWTAPLGDDGRTAWTEWCSAEEYGDPTEPITELIPDPDARVYVINTVADLVALESTYRDEHVVQMVPHRSPWPALDWTAMARDLDAIWLTDEGQWATRFSQPGLYGWDCETVFWLNPRVRVAG